MGESVHSTSVQCNSCVKQHPERRQHPACIRLVSLEIFVHCKVRLWSSHLKVSLFTSAKVRRVVFATFRMLTFAVQELGSWASSGHLPFHCPTSTNWGSYNNQLCSSTRNSVYSNPIDDPFRHGNTHHPTALSNP